ncbi:MAG: polysaccharide deacetylase family protein [Desulfobacteraceae bacterium]|nr:polysaccharide deacetylase family protein [Desulfobacteraceae bacterium]
MFNVISLKDSKTKIHRFLNRRMGTILTYHSVIGVPADFDLWTHIPVDLFEEHMLILSKEANVISLEQMVQGIIDGRLPKYSVVVTFDDGFRNNFTRAYPILNKYKIPATIFLSTGFMDGAELFWPERIAFQVMRTKKRTLENSIFGSLNFETISSRKESYLKIKEFIRGLHPYAIPEKLMELETLLEADCVDTDPLYREWLPLRWDDITSMDTEGLVSMGGHTVNHTILRWLDENQASKEIVGCRTALDEHLSQKTAFWAYPNGTYQDFNEKHVNMLKENDFKVICTAETGYVCTQSDIGMLNRIGVGNKMSAKNMMNVLAKRNHLAQHKGVSKISALMAALMPH